MKSPADESTPTRSLTITVNGTPYEVELGDLTTSPLVVYVNGEPYTVTIESTAEASPCEPPRVMAVEPAEPLRRREHAFAKSEGCQVTQVTAPMPGNVLDIAVAVGDQVSFRDVLCALEAMKMKTAIQSPRDGTIASLEVVEGQPVAHGEVLFTFE